MENEASVEQESAEDEASVEQESAEETKESEYQGTTWHMSTDDEVFY